MLRTSTFQNAMATFLGLQPDEQKNQQVYVRGPDSIDSAL